MHLPWLQNVCPQGVATIMGESQGGFAERIRANAALAQQIPEGIDLAEAAPLLCAGVTVWSPISRYVTKPGMKVVLRSTLLRDSLIIHQDQ